MTAEEWQDRRAQCFGLMLNGKAGDYRTPEGEPADDDFLLIVINATTTSCRSRLPHGRRRRWLAPLPRHDRSGAWPTTLPCTAVGEVVRAARPLAGPVRLRAGMSEAA